MFRTRNIQRCLVSVLWSHPRDAIFAWAAVAYYPAGGICDMNRPPLNLFLEWGPAAYNAIPPCDGDGVSFLGLFVSYEAGRRGAQGAPFFHGNDLLYTLRLWRAGGVFCLTHCCGLNMTSPP